MFQQGSLAVACISGVSDVDVCVLQGSSQQEMLPFHSGGSGGGGGGV